MVVDDRVIRKKFGREYIEISHDEEADKFALSVINWLLQNYHYQTDGRTGGSIIIGLA
jgi:hypothetical protein